MPLLKVAGHGSLVMLLVCFSRQTWRPPQPTYLVLTSCYRLGIVATVDDRRDKPHEVADIWSQSYLVNRRFGLFAADFDAKSAAIAPQALHCLWFGSPLVSCFQLQLRRHLGPAPSPRVG